MLPKVSLLETASPGMINISPQQVMIQVQVMLLENFDDQIRSLAEKLKGENKVYERFGEAIDKIQNFQAQAENSSRKEGRKYFEASARQMTDMFGAMNTFHWNSGSNKVDSAPLRINDTGDDHNFEASEIEIKSDTSTVDDWARRFEKIDSLETSQHKMEEARKVGDDDGELFFYFGHTNNRFEDGSPKFSVFSDGVQKMTDRMRQKLDVTRQSIDKMTSQMSQLTQQRKRALDQLSQMLNQQASLRETALKNVI